MPDTKIGPCPWCKIADANEQVVTREKLLYKCEPFQVYCSCGARGPHADTREEAVAKWNKAPAAGALRDAWAEIDRLREAAEGMGARLARLTVKLSRYETENVELKQKLSAGRDGWIEKTGDGQFTLHIEPAVNPSLDEALNSGKGDYKP